MDLGSAAYAVRVEVEECGLTRGERLAKARVGDAVDLGAEILVTACPFCLTTLDDVVKTAGKDDVIQVMDVAGLVAKAI